jgi:hypothetical protein
MSCPPALILPLQARAPHSRSRRGTHRVRRAERRLADQRHLAREMRLVPDMQAKGPKSGANASLAASADAAALGSR